MVLSISSGQEPLMGPSVEHTEENASCGDELTLRLKIENGKIMGLSWAGAGCAISQAAMSMLSEELVSMTVADAEKLPTGKIYSLLGVPVGPRRFKCALLGLHTLKNTLRKQADQAPQPWTATVGLEN